jgi:hypothetical protein
VPPDVPVLPPMLPEPPIVPVEPPMLPVPPMVPVEPPMLPVPPIVPVLPPIVPVVPIEPGVEVEPLPDMLPVVEPDVPRLRPRERVLRDEVEVVPLCTPEPLLDIEPVVPDCIEPPIAEPVVPLVPVVWAKAAAGIINAAAAAMVKIRMEVSPVVLAC